MKLALSLLLSLMLAGQAGAEVLEFSGPGCAPCMQYAPTIDRLIAEGLPIRKINVAADPQTKDQWHVDRWPTTIAVRDGREVERVLGPQSESKVRQLCAESSSTPIPSAGSRMTYDSPPPGQANLKPVLARCRVQCANGDTGSGTLIAANGRTALVLTANHVTKDCPQDVDVLFSNRVAKKGKVIDSDAFYDLAAILIYDPGIEPVKVDPSVPDGQIAAGGFGSDGQFKAVKGSIVGWETYSQTGNTEPNPYMNGEVREGDSGGGVLDEKHNLRGVLWGCSAGQTHFCCGRPLQSFVKRVDPSCGMPNGGPPPEVNTGTNNPLPPNPVVPDPPAQSTCPCGDIDAKITAEVRLQIAALNLHDGQDGQQGPKGEQGPQGPKGDTGLTGAAGVSPSAKEIADNVTIPQIDIDAVSTAVLAKLPPFYERANPNEQWQPVKLGQYLDLSLNKQQAAAKQ